MISGIPGIGPVAKWRTVGALEFAVMCGISSDCVPRCCANSLCALRRRHSFFCHKLTTIRGLAGADDDSSDAKALILEDSTNRTVGGQPFELLRTTSVSALVRSSLLSFSCQLVVRDFILMC